MGIEGNQPTTKAPTARRGVASSLLALASCVVAALALVTVLAPVTGTAKSKHKHRAKRATRVVFSDAGTNPDPASIWGKVDCANQSRAQQFSSGGDTHLTATGNPPGDSAYRRLTVIDGDDVYGERCELGLDNRKGPTALFRQGRHRITEISIRLPSAFPLSAYTWQDVMQMKEAWPFTNSSGSPVLELDAYNGRWVLGHSDSAGETPNSRGLWSAPARANFWTRFAFDVRYSDNKKGYIRVGADLNGDGDFADPGELSPGFHTHTLKREVAGGEPDGLKPGQAIPSHLRAGVYHDPMIQCPAPTGCPIDIDNVQVVRP
jgi:polysaccharide lyase-like protein